MISGPTTSPPRNTSPRDRVADVCATLFDWYKKDRLQGVRASAHMNDNQEAPQEKTGPFIHRQGYQAVLDQLKADDRTTDLLEKHNPAMVFDPYIETELLDR